MSGRSRTEQLLGIPEPPRQLNQWRRLCSTGGAGMLRSSEYHNQFYDVTWRDSLDHQVDGLTPSKQAKRSIFPKA